MLKVPPLPDVAKLASRYLRTVPEVALLVGNRVYTVFPKQLDASSTFVLVQRIGGSPPLSRPLVVDTASIQLDAYAGSHDAADELSAVCRSALSQWHGEQPDAAGNVCGVIVGAKRYVADVTYKPPKPRYVCDFEVTVKPAGVVLAGNP